MFGEGPAVAVTDESIGADTIAQFARSKGATKMANFALSDPFGPPAARVQAKAFEKLGGKEVLSVLDLPLENPDFTAIIQKIKDSNADYIQAGFNQQIIVQFGKALAQAGIKPKVAILGQGYQEDILKALGSAAEGMTFTLEFAPFELNLPAHKQYLEGLAKVAPGEPRGIQSMVGWLGAEAFIKGLEVAGKNPTRESFITNLRQVHDYDAGGLIAPFDYSTIQQSTERCYYFVTVKDGKFVPDGKNAKCGKIVTDL
jgi:branched-chain amino acid transport system substrate-binding protein